MAFARPTLTQLIDRNQADIETRLPGTDPRLRFSILGILARALSGAVHGLYGAQEYTALQIVPDSADSANLERTAFWLGRGMTRNSATAAIGNITFAGTNGSVIPASTTLQRSDGEQYTVNAEVTIAAGTAIASVTSVNTGQIVNAIAGQKLTLVNPIAGVQSTATVATGGITGGTDKETDTALLARLREFISSNANGTNLAQYEIWAKQVSGVTRAWAFDKWLGIGTVGLFFVRDNDASLIPDAGEVATVQTYIDARRTPGLVGFTAYAPVAASQNMTIKLSPNTTTVQAAVQAELADLFLLEASVENGSGSGKILLTHINEAISRASGEADHLLVSPASDITLSAGQIATLGTITWQAL